jgi:hypothetical protein
MGFASAQPSRGLRAIRSPAGIRENARRSGQATLSRPFWVGIELNFSEAKLTFGCFGGYLGSLVRTLASGGTEIRIFAADSRGVPSAKAKAVRVPVVTCWWDNNHRPVPLIIGSAKLRVMLGRRGHLNRQSRDQQRAESSENCLPHARLHWLDIRSRQLHLAIRVVLMRQSLSHQHSPSWSGTPGTRVVHLTSHEGFTANPLCLLTPSVCLLTSNACCARWAIRRRV